ncbi:MAG: 50S ribosomal protein L30 [Bacillota bacterium]|jgi:large subunit ribosomal protein L30
MAKIKITLTKSPIGYNKKQKATLVALGLKKMNSSVIHEDTPDIVGKTQTVAHLVTVESADAQ